MRQGHSLVSQYLLVCINISFAAAGVELDKSYEFLPYYIVQYQCIVPSLRGIGDRDWDFESQYPCGSLRSCYNGVWFTGVCSLPLLIAKYEYATFPGWHFSCNMNSPLWGFCCIVIQTGILVLSGVRSLPLLIA